MNEKNDIKGLAERLAPLIGYLDNKATCDGDVFHEWKIERIRIGTNNRVFCIVNKEERLALKFMKIDERSRAQREYNGLTYLAESGFQGSPRPILLDTGHSQPVVIEEWISGTVLDEPPFAEIYWQDLFRLYAELHNLRCNPADPRIQLNAANVQNIASAKKRIAFAAKNPVLTGNHNEINSLVLAALSAVSNETASDSVAFCRCDPCITNFIIDIHGTIRSVDWENCGWGDPLFEMGDLAAHPSYCHMDPDDIFGRISLYYLERRSRNEALQTINDYAFLSVIWWLVVFSRRTDKTDLYQKYLSRSIELLNNRKTKK